VGVSPRHSKNGESELILWALCARKISSKTAQVE
jgi:hypothetical protein